jgi:hypothetical protein
MSINQKATFYRCMSLLMFLIIMVLIASMGCSRPPSVSIPKRKNITTENRYESDLAAIKNAKMAMEEAQSQFENSPDKEEIDIKKLKAEIYKITVETYKISGQVMYDDFGKEKMPYYENDLAALDNIKVQVKKAQLQFENSPAEEEIGIKNKKAEIYKIVSEIYKIRVEIMRHYREKEQIPHLPDPTPSPIDKKTTSPAPVSSPIPASSPVPRSAHGEVHTYVGSGRQVIQVQSGTHVYDDGKGHIQVKYKK